MLETGNNNMTSEKLGRLLIRVGNDSLAFAHKNEDGSFAYTTYATKRGISMAANLKEALKDEELHIGMWKKVFVLIDSPVIMIPIDEYNEQNKESLYRHSVTGQENSSVLATILPSVNTVALYSLNKDLRTVLTDNFSDIKIHPVCASVWQYLQRRSLRGEKEKLYCYFHDGKLEVCSFRKNRFRFANAFAVSHAKDITYFILSVWQQLGMNTKTDEIYLLGNFPDYEGTTDELHKFTEAVYKINASADFNRHALTQRKDVPFDIITTLLK